MYDSGKIIAGLIIFVLFVTFPIWYNHGDAGAVPKVELPKDTKECVLPADRDAGRAYAVAQRVA